MVIKLIVFAKHRQSSLLETSTAVSCPTFSHIDLYKLTDEVLGQGAYAKVQGCVSLQNGQEFAVKVSHTFFPANE